MKRLILAIALAAPFAYADQSKCQKIGQLSSKIMESRQRGAPMSDLMQIAGDSELMQQIVIDAYETPRFSSDKYQENAIKDFRSEWELACYKAMKGST